MIRCFFAILLVGSFSQGPALADSLRVAPFDCDVTPAPGSQLTYHSMKRVGELGLRCRGVVLLGKEQPVVLCALDWIGIANEGYSEFRLAIAQAAGTDPQRVALQVLHQHDAPICDFTTERILKDIGVDPGPFRAEITRPLFQKVADAIRASLPGAVEVTHMGWGQAVVHELASNRRVFDVDGKFLGERYTSCQSEILRAAPEGVIDPLVRVLSFWKGDEPVAILSYFATHPQSYYGTGVANPDFPGIARFLRGQAVPEALHVHFCGAGGNIGAGKYNDGAPPNRAVLAYRLADGMSRAFAATCKQAVSDSDLGWEVVSVNLPPSSGLNEEALEMALLAGKGRPGGVLGTAMQLAWLRSTHDIGVSCLRLGSVRLLHLPGELFVEYQLAAAAYRPDLQVAMAAYGEYGPGYIGTEKSYGEEGYEVQPTSSFVAPECEAILTAAIHQLLDTPPK